MKTKEPTDAMLQKALEWRGFVGTFEASEFDKGREYGFSYGMAHAAELIESWLRLFTDDPHICNEIADAIARGDWFGTDEHTPQGK